MNRFILSLLVITLLLVSGCGPRGPVVVPVTGTVTLDGTPVEGASVMFMPVAAGAAPAGGTLPAVGKTDKDGKFELETDGKKGAVEGDYAVVVSKITMEGIKVNEDGTSGEAGTMRTTYHLPVKYGKKESSGFQQAVKKGMPAVDLKLSKN
ncbi:hypothetical protein NA78x_004961 [Anatilimnocola sp. NA78]|uniref:hypothetical protein n=1 Tax=Anatilimnocola sp. NA78 TaxID=3415683 RepID=UPI003CE4A71F